MLVAVGLHDTGLRCTVVTSEPNTSGALPSKANANATAVSASCSQEIC